MQGNENSKKGKLHFLAEDLAIRRDFEPFLFALGSIQPKRKAKNHFIIAPFLLKKCIKSDCLASTL